MTHTPNTGKATAPTRSTPRHAAPSGHADRQVIARLVALVVAAIVAAIVLWPSNRAEESVAQPAAASGETAWQNRLAGLYDVRAEAFGTGQADLLAHVYTVDSRQLRADLETIESLNAQNRDVVGFAPRLIEVESVSQSGDNAVAVVRDEIETFAIIDETGTQMPVAGRSPARTTLQLQRVEGIWLIADAQRATG